jgi:hypothetical protein
MARQTCVRYEQEIQWPDRYDYWLLEYDELDGQVLFTYRCESWINRDWFALRFKKQHLDITRTCIIFRDSWRDVNTLEKVPWRDVNVLNEWLCQYKLAKKLNRKL